MQHLYVLLLFVVILSSCAPLRVVRMEPVPDDIDRYEYGNAVAVEETPGTEVQVNFFDADRQYVVFDVRVKNTGTEPFNYDPAEATLTAPFGNVFQAIDPEAELLGMDINDIRRERRRRVLNGATAALTVAAVVYAGTDAGAGAADAAQVVSTEQVVLDAAATSVDLATLAFIAGEPQPGESENLPGFENRYFWRDATLRRTTVDPGETAEGKILFVRTIVDGEYTLSLPINGEMVEMRFVQTVYDGKK